MSDDDVRALVARHGRICGRVAVAALALQTLAACSAADQATAPTVQIGPLQPPPPRPDAGAVQDDPSDYMLGDIEIDPKH